MKKVTLISCVSKKLGIKSKAKDLYQSSLFKKNIAYAKLINSDEIYILSAKYGLLKLNDEIEPYDKTLNSMNKLEKEKWSNGVFKQIQNIEKINNTNFIFLAGENYRKYLVKNLPYFEVPMKGLTIGKQGQFLKEKLTMSNICNDVHNIFQNMERYRFPFNEPDIPKNGIYILFEKNELAHNGERIVRVGTHRGDDRLVKRLKEHFIKENKDRSIFRKNIGRAILSKNNDIFLKQWNWDLTSKITKDKYSSLLDLEKQKLIEKDVSKYIKSNFSFIVLEVKTKTDRLNLESKLISSISLCKDCKPSNSWLGKYSPIQKIKESGLWLVQGLYKMPLNRDEFEKIKAI